MGLSTPSGSTGALAPMVMIVNNVNKEEPKTKEKKETKDK
jgi:hypothetical protein